NLRPFLSSALASIHKVMAVVIPKELKKTLKLKKGDTLEAKVDDKNGLLNYKRDIINSYSHLSKITIKLY
ncbi:MAG TPA: AbrB/MazE/SpoVT family DNA-binding domain-containing protein, partial [Nitrososphaeraceae archaeon]|nr:AbrB/MazE/SpoVT family DNA-binding domain-containing protein [Nitrososphaeraceae archaeon]